MKHQAGTISWGLALLLACTPGLSAAVFISGSTEADGAFNPTVNTELQLPPNGIFNFTSVNIPTGVTVTFRRNTTNTPVVMLASGNVTIAGTLSLSGSVATPAGAAGNGNLGDDGQPGVGSPGGYDGGRGGAATPNRRGGNGLGLGGGSGAQDNYPACCGSTFYYHGGAGGSFGTVGDKSWPYDSSIAQPGITYGSSLLLPLTGGSGGGGGSGGTSYQGSGGGGAGGAILIAASGTVTISGFLTARGNSGGEVAGTGAGGAGGGGSGGAIRVVATTIAGNGTVSAVGGTGGSARDVIFTAAAMGGNGGAGRIRLEAENITRTAATNPVHTFGAPGSIFITGLPSLLITSVAGVTAPANPTGNADITLPASTPNPVTVTFTTTGVPVGNTVRLTVTPATSAPPATAVSTALTGSTENATASLSVNLPTGPSTLSATTTYTITASLGDEMSRFAAGERVEKVTLSAALNGPSLMILTTVSGKEFTVPSSSVAALPGG